MYKVPSQEGKFVVVTGANSGTGKETARRLAGAGAHVIMTVRRARRYSPNSLTPSSKCARSTLPISRR